MTMPGVSLVAERAGRLPMNEPAFVAFYARTAGPLKGYLRRLTGDPAAGREKADEGIHFRHLASRRLAAEPCARSNVPEAAGDVWCLLARLRPRDRELLILAYVEGMTHREIASVTGLVTASVKPLLFRARRRFARELRAGGFGAPDVTGGDL